MRLFFQTVLLFSLVFGAPQPVRADWLELFNQTFFPKKESQNTKSAPKKATQPEKPLTFIEREQRRQQNAVLSEETGIDIPPTFDPKKLTQSGDAPSSIEEYKMIMAIKQNDQRKAVERVRAARRATLAGKTKRESGFQGNTPNYDQIYLTPGQTQRLQIQPYSPPEQ